MDTFYPMRPKKGVMNGSKSNTTDAISHTTVTTVSPVKSCSLHSYYTECSFLMVMKFISYQTKCVYHQSSVCYTLLRCINV